VVEDFGGSLHEVIITSPSLAAWSCLKAKNSLAFCAKYHINQRKKRSFGERPGELARARLATPFPYSTPAIVQLGGRQLVADRVVSGPLCNDTWRGTVYVGCDVRVPEWSDDPVFLKDCHLQVEPGTVVYVAAHNNSAYYQGCSCHTGEVTPP
jgi:hypothetical protein